MSRIKMLAFSMLAISIALILGLLIIEIGYRVYVYATVTIDETFPGIAVLDHPLPKISHLLKDGNVFGPYFPRTVYRMTHFARDNRPINPHQFHTNNLGWASHYDYAVEKPLDEYRVAVVGASLVASVTNEHPWPDALQRLLDNDQTLKRLLGVNRITVMSFGLGGAPFQSMVRPGLATALRFSPDFVVVNFATENVANPVSVAMPYINRETIGGTARTLSYPSKEGGFVTVDGIRIGLTCPGRVKPSLFDPRCVASPHWFAANDADIQPEHIARVKRRFASAIVRDRILLSPFPLTLYSAIGYPPFPRAVEHAMKADGITVALEAFHAIRTAHADVLFAHNPIEQDLNGDQSRHELIGLLFSQALAHQYDMVKMENYLPRQFGKSEFAKWYIPDDGHFSDYGAGVYARAMYYALRNRLLASRGSPPAWPDSLCDVSFVYMQSGDRAQQQDRPTDALAFYDRAVDSLPKEAIDIYGQNAGYGACSFIPTLFASLSLMLEKSGDARASAVGDVAISLLGDGYDFFRRRAALRKAVGAKGAAVRDYDEMVKLRSDSIEALEARADAYIEINQPEQAEADYSAVLALTPDNFGAVFGRAQARIMRQDFTGSLEDIDRLLSYYPNEGAFYYLRAVSMSNLGKIDDALRELDRALELLPNHKPSLDLRNDLRSRAAMVKG